MSNPLEIEVLGCHGGEMAGFLTPSLMINKTIMLDAGSFSTVLSLKQQLQIDHILVSHSHIDHVKDLAGFADLVIGRRSQPVMIHASRRTLRVLRKDFFNNRLWPDFFMLPSPDVPVLKEAAFEPNKTFKIDNLNVKAVEVSHPVESMGFIVRGPNGSFVYSGDTGPTTSLWEQVSRVQKLKLLMIECKFPNEMQMVANAAGHLTPRTLEQELKKIKVAENVPIYLYHLKPDHYPDIEKQIKALKDTRLQLMKIGDRYKV